MRINTSRSLKNYLRALKIGSNDSFDAYDSQRSFKRKKKKDERKNIRINFLKKHIGLALFQNYLLQLIQSERSHKSSEQKKFWWFFFMLFVRNAEVSKDISCMERMHWDKILHASFKTEQSTSTFLKEIDSQIFIEDKRFI